MIVDLAELFIENGMKNLSRRKITMLPLKGILKFSVYNSNLRECFYGEREEISSC